MRKLVCLFIMVSCLQASLELELARQYFQKGQADKAIAAYEKVLDNSQDSLEAHYGLAKIYVLNENWLKAFFHLRETLAIQRNFKDASALMTQAVEALKNTLSSQTPETELEYVARIQLHFLNDELEDARDVIAKGLRQYPQSAWIEDHRARFFYELGQFQRALDSMRKAMSLAPDSSVIFNHYEMVLYRVEHGIQKPRQQGSEASTMTAPATIPASPEPNLEAETQTALSKNPVPTPDPTVSSKSFYQKLLKKELASLPPQQPASATPAASKTTEVTVAYVPPAPPSKLVADIQNTEAELIQTAKTAYDSKNWDQAIHHYMVLSHNNPSNSTYSERLSRAETYQAFEIDFLNARREFALGAKNPERLQNAKNLFENLDPETYRILHNKTSFGDYLGRIAWAQGQYKKAVKKLTEYMQTEPADVSAGWILVRALDETGQWNRAYSVLNELYEYDAAATGAKRGVSRMYAKLSLWQWRWPVFGFLIFWALATLIYTTFKSYRLKKSQDRKYQFQQIKNLHVDQSYREMIRKIDALLLMELSASEIYNLQYLKANGLYQLGDLEQAERQIRSVLSRHTSDPQSLVLLGKVHNANNHVDADALPGYRALFQKEPSNLGLLKNYLASLKVSKMQGEEFERVALRLLELESYDQSVLQDLVEYYAREQITNDRAADVYRQYLEIHPGAMSVALQYLRCLIQMNNFIEAVRMGKNLVHRNPDLEKAHRLLIRAFDELSMHQEMKDWYADLSLEYPSSSIVQHMNDLIAANYRGASQVVEEEFKDESGDAAAMQHAFEKGQKLLQKGDFQNAVIHLQQAWQDEHYSREAGVLLVQAFLQLKDHKSAQLYFEGLNFTKGKPSETEMEVLYEMAEIYTSLKMKRKALRCYQTIARHDVSYKDVFQRIELLNLEGA